MKCAPPVCRLIDRIFARPAGARSWQDPCVLEKFCPLSRVPILPADDAAVSACDETDRRKRAPNG